MTLAGNKAVVRRFYEAIDRGDFAVLEALVTENWDELGFLRQIGILPAAPA